MVNTNLTRESMLPQVAIVPGKLDINYIGDIRKLFRTDPTGDSCIIPILVIIA